MEVVCSKRQLRDHVVQSVAEDPVRGRPAPSELGAEGGVQEKVKPVAHGLEERRRHVEEKAYIGALVLEDGLGAKERLRVEVKHGLAQA